MFNQKGSILIVVYLVISVLVTIGAVLVSRSVIDKRLYDMNFERTQAFYLAEAAVDAAIANLQGDYGYSGTSTPVAFGDGEYESSVTTVNTANRKIVATGYIPTKANPRVVRQIEAVTKKETPPDFFENAIYSAGYIDFEGVSYEVNGKVIYATTIENPVNVNGTVTRDPSIAPLAHFDFAVLRDIAIAQNNYYTPARLSAGVPFPTDFWYVEPTDPSDPTTGIPNVVYVEGALRLSGNDTVGGFYLVVGNILTDPEVIIDTTITGNITVNGSIYTTGNFTIKGGGNSLNVDGGVWAGTGADIRGNAKIDYDYDYMMSIKHLIETNNAGAAVQLLSWRQLQ